VGKNVSEDMNYEEGKIEENTSKFENTAANQNNLSNKIIKPIAPTAETEQERRMQRAARFKIELSLEEKLEIRAKRFNTCITEANPSVNDAPQNTPNKKILTEEKFLERAARFGIISKETEELKKKKRMERFNALKKDEQMKEGASLEKDKMQNRSKRFNTGKRVGGYKPKLDLMEAKRRMNISNGNLFKR